ncbi:MAG: hypothetical protein IJW85_01515 [Clostridia bacterium]|nr:hypothetical protein [Clostridia bacterium]
MSDPKTVSPYFCLPLLEDALPDSGTATADSFQLPASFPAELLDEEQLEAVAAWFDTWVADLLHSMRLALLGKHGTPADLAHLHQHATVLAHLLRLHPAAEATITELATTLGVSRRTLFYVRDSVLAHIRPALAGTIARKCAVANFYAQLATIGTLDAATITQLDARTILVPFKPHVHCAHRFATVRQLASLPAVASVKETLTTTGKNAVQIAIK